MNKDCENYESSWCADFGDNCNECPVFSLRSNEQMTKRRDKPPMLSNEEIERQIANKICALTPTNVDVDRCRSIAHEVFVCNVEPLIQQKMEESNARAILLMAMTDKCLALKTEVQQTRRESYDAGYAQAVMNNQGIIGQRENFWQAQVKDEIKQAKAEVAREIFEEIEAEVFDVNDETRRLNLMVINENAAYEWWQSLKSKYMEGK